MISIKISDWWSNTDMISVQISDWWSNTHMISVIQVVCPPMIMPHEIDDQILMISVKISDWWSNTDKDMLALVG